MDTVGFEPTTSCIRHYINAKHARYPCAKSPYTFLWSDGTEKSHKYFGEGKYYFFVNFGGQNFRVRVCAPCGGISFALAVYAKRS